ncbi:MAG TPA: response regulator transcription factor [Gammaproteobacteria bacterium]|jgi:two-component system response regulator RegA|nr:response regulator transcription factor [Gammaproteobacteria bacterium]
MDEVRRILIVDDDEIFCGVLSRALQRRGFETRVAGDIASALNIAAVFNPGDCVVDLKLGGDSGLELVAKLAEILPAAHILVLTGYASIATAVQAIKLGATNYLAKPADADAILAMLSDSQPDPSVLPNNAPSVRRVEWEHIHRVLNEHGGNISETARALGMHRRTLQRKLNKKPMPR